MRLLVNAADSIGSMETRAHDQIRIVLPNIRRRRIDRSHSSMRDDGYGVRAKSNDVTFSRQRQCILEWRYSLPYRIVGTHHGNFGVFDCVNCISFGVLQSLYRYSIRADILRDVGQLMVCSHQPHLQHAGLYIRWSDGHFICRLTLKLPYLL